MLSRFKKLFYLAIVVTVLSCHNRPAQIPIKSFFNRPDKTQFHVSPDGKYISYLKRTKDSLGSYQYNIYLYNIADDKETPATPFKTFNVRDHFWTYNNQIIIVQASRGRRDSLHLLAINTHTLKMDTLLSEPKVNFKFLNRNITHPDMLTFTMNLRDSAKFDVYRINTRTGELKIYIENSGNIVQWYTDKDGGIKLEKASDGVNETILYRDNDNSPFKPILQNNFKNVVEPIAFTGEKNLFYARSNVNRDKAELVEINAENGKEEKTIFGNGKTDIEDVAYSKSKQRLEMVSWQGPKPQKHFFNNTIKNLYADIAQQLPGDEIRIFDRDTSEQHFLLNTFSDRNPGSTYLYTAQTKKLLKLGDQNAEINPADMCEMKPISYKTNDGLLINGYLTLPKGNDTTNLPVVVIPNNDLWKRNNWDYNEDVQFLANRGYAVFQVNYRGTTGYGKTFFSAGFKQIGGKAQQDITDGVKWLISQKIADPKRIAIYGTGLGGFSALYGASCNPGLYNCVAVRSPLINFFTFFKDVPPFFKPKLNMLYEMIGSPETDADRFRSISPFFNSNKIKAPLFIVQGDHDPNAGSGEELGRFVSDVKKNGVPVTYIPKDTGKGKDEKKSMISDWKKGGRRDGKRDSVKIAIYTQLENFLETNLGKK